MKHEGCALTGGAFLKEINQFLDEYYDGKVVMGRVRSAKPIEWDDTGVDRSPYQFFMDYPPIVRCEPLTVFKETKVVKVPRM